MPEASRQALFCFDLVFCIPVECKTAKSKLSQPKSTTVPTPYGRGQASPSFHTGYRGKRSFLLVLSPLIYLFTKPRLRHLGKKPVFTHLRYLQHSNSARPTPTSSCCRLTQCRRGQWAASTTVFQPCQLSCITQPQPQA